ncbi:hypothetical protein PUN28_017208 [Cardiocondyla obscurior]|uniref:Uncharacterized protein n=1 Tax=Cardiocondyla obscurior TaxID=286306 RepID=A0AAW2EKS1_9HYME
MPRVFYQQLLLEGLFHLFYNCKKKYLSHLIRDTWLVIRVEDVHDALGRSYRYGAFFHNNLISRRNFCNHPGSTLYIFQIGSPSLTVAECLCRCIYRNKYQIGLLDRRVDIRGEK